MNSKTLARIERMGLKMGAFPLRAGTMHDLPIVLKFYLAYLEEMEHVTLTPHIVHVAAMSVQEVLSNNGGLAMMCEDNGIVVGCYCCQLLHERLTDGMYVQVFPLYVLPNYRTLGVGEQLVVKMVEYAKSRNATRIAFMETPEECSKWIERLGGRISLVEYEIPLCETGE